MDKVAVITDSTAALPKDLVQKYDIHVMPLKIIFGDKSYRDGVDITPSEFYSLLRKSDKLPTTSAPSPNEFLAVYRELSRKTNSIACILLSSKLSMSFDAAMQAKKLAEKELKGTRIEVIDSHTSAGALGFAVQEAARTAAAGGTLAEVIEAAQKVISRVQLFAAFETLHYLAKGGRIGKAAAWAGTLLNLKPIITLPTSTGEVAPVERPRTKSRAVQRLLELMKERVNAKPVHVNVLHADAPQEAERLKEQVLAQFNCVEIYVSEFTPVMGTHTGPGVLVLTFYPEE